MNNGRREPLRVLTSPPCFRSSDSTPPAGSPQRPSSATKPLSTSARPTATSYCTSTGICGRTAWGLVGFGRRTVAEYHRGVVAEDVAGECSVMSSAPWAPRQRSGPILACRVEPCGPRDTSALCPVGVLGAPLAPNRHASGDSVPIATSSNTG
jgi:hypothetical protein